MSPVWRRLDGWGWWRLRAWAENSPRGRMSVPAALVWLAFIVFPLVNAVTDKAPLVRHVLAVVGATLFVAVYVWLVLSGFAQRRRRLARELCLTLVVIALVLTLADRAGWGFLFTYCAACVALVAPSEYNFPAVAALALLSAAATLIAGGGAGAAIGYGASTIGIGLLMVLLSDLRTRNQELTEARAELARVAVAQERERFARDLHDLLGHTLSVIALKAELAGKLAVAQPDEAAREMGEVEGVARQALSEVRQAVSGYRQPTLDGELAGARLALSAAGISADLERGQMTLAPDVEAVLAWAVREGATNVIRHSGARHCTVRVHGGLGDAQVEVIDDGMGTNAHALGLNGSGDGNGLAGLSERAQELHGRVEAGARGDGDGFRLAVSVPVG